MPRGIDKRVVAACKAVWMEHRAALRNKGITIKAVWENHIPSALEMYPTRLWPKDSWFIKKVSEWESETPYEEVPKDLVIKPWGNDWGEDPSRVSVLTALYGHTQDVLEGQDPNYRLEGFPKRVCDWAVKLSDFFDIGSRRECLYLLRHAYRFEKEASIRMASPDPSDDMAISYKAFDDLIRWQQHKAGNLLRPRRTREHHKYRGPQLDPEITEIEEAYIWEQSEADLEMNLAFDVRGATGFRSHGNGEAYLLIDDKWIPISINTRYQENDKPTAPQQVSPSSEVIPNKLLDELRSQGLPIDEDHAALGMVYTNPPVQEESEVAEEELLDGAYRVIGMTTTDQMIMPVETPSSGNSSNTLTQDSVLKLVSELLEDPGTLSRERAAELGMDLVATFDEILNRHNNEEEINNG